jgi:hypothetical protein
MAAHEQPLFFSLDLQTCFPEGPRDFLNGYAQYGPQIRPRGVGAYAVTHADGTVSSIAHRALLQAADESPEYDVLTDHEVLQLALLHTAPFQTEVSKVRDVRHRHHAFTCGNRPELIAALAEALLVFDHRSRILTAIPQDLYDKAVEGVQLIGVVFQDFAERRKQIPLRFTNSALRHKSSRAMMRDIMGGLVELIHTYGPAGFVHAVRPHWWDAFDTLIHAMHTGFTVHGPPKSHYPHKAIFAAISPILECFKVHTPERPALTPGALQQRWQRYQRLRLVPQANETRKGE